MKLSPPPRSPAGVPRPRPGLPPLPARPARAGPRWFTSTATGTHLGTFAGYLRATGKRFEPPPQACSVVVDRDGKIAKYTIGHVMERSVGNTGGLGGVFGPLVAVGAPLPFPEARPYKPSKRYRVVQLLGSLAQKRKDRQERKAAAAQAA